MCANKTSQQGLLTCPGKQRGEAVSGNCLPTARTVSFVKVWLAVGIGNMEGCRLQSTSPHSMHSPKDESSSYKYKGKIKRGKIIAFKMHMWNAKLWLFSQVPLEQFYFLRCHSVVCFLCHVWDNKYNFAEDALPRLALPAFHSNMLLVKDGCSLFWSLVPLNVTSNAWF